MADLKPTLPEASPAARAAFLAEARAIEPEHVLPMRGDALLAEKNIAAGVAAVLAYDAHVASHLPHVDLRELRSLPDLARAVLEAVREAGPGDEAEELLVEAHALRRTLRAAVIALVEAGVLGHKDLAKVGKDRGAVDVGAECAALASLLQRRAADIEGQTPAGEADVSRAVEVASALRALFKPAGAARKPGPDGVSPIEVRDRLWTLLVIRHERLWAVGAYVYGHAVDEHVPALHAPIATRAGKSRARNAD